MSEKYERKAVKLVFFLREDGNMETTAEIDPGVSGDDFTYQCAAEAMAHVQRLFRKMFGDDAVEKIGEVGPTRKKKIDTTTLN
jgi:SpoVK/Ycf46/Vps4 family AAA+-type ATPase